ncbi:hypothetical protein JCM15765_02610 [Paradesulfitobacterium aromaticivorans]
MTLWSENNVNYQDGGTGFIPLAGSAHIKIGYCTGLAAGSYKTITKERDLDELGSGPLVDACLDTLQTKGGIIIALAVAASVAGTSTDVVHAGTGLATFTKTGNPNGEYQVVMEVLLGGALNTAQYRLSLDGGDSWGVAKTIPLDGVVATDTGITLTFTNAVDPAQSFVAGDRYSFETTPPQMSNQDFLDAMGVVKSNPFSYEFIHVVGPSSSALWAVCGTEADTLAADMLPIYFMCETRNIGDAETIDTYVQALITEKGTFAHTRVGVVAGRLEVADLKGRLRDANMGAIVTGIISKSEPQESAGKVQSFRMTQAMSIKPDGFNMAHAKMLHDAGFTVPRIYNQYPGIYVEEANLMAPPGSDFQAVKSRRVVDRAAVAAYQAGMFYLKSEMFADELDNLKANMERPLEDMVKRRNIAGFNLQLVSSASEQIDWDLAVTEVETMRVLTTTIHLQRG